MRAHFLFLAVAFLFSQGAKACENLAPILNGAYPDTASNLNVEKNVRCKIWPGHPQWTLIAVTIPRGDPEEDQREPEADLDILVVDSKTGTVRHRLREPGMMNSDAYRKSLQGLDTAHYAVSPQALVFGVRTASVAGGRGHESAVEHLTLYALAGERVVRIMDDYLVSLDNQESAEFSDVKRDKSCGEREAMKAYLVVETGVHHGFRDIAIPTSYTNSQCTLTSKDEDRWVRTQLRKETDHLVYDGTRYVPQKNNEGG
jgi:hypothetical protein